MLISRLIVKISVISVCLCVLLLVGFSAIGQFVPEGWQVHYYAMVSDTPFNRWVVYEHDIDRNLAYPLYINFRHVPDGIDEFGGWDHPISLSPNNRYLAQNVFIESGGWDTYLLDLYTNDMVALEYDGLRELIWSPDGQHFVYHTFIGSRLEIVSIGEGLYSIETVDLGNAWFGGDLRWSSDGEYLLFTSDTDSITPKRDIYIFAVSDRTVSNVTNTPDVHELSPIWSPDDNNIVYTVITAQQVFVTYHISLTDGQVTQLPIPPSENIVIDWSPDDEFLLFVSRQASYYDFEIYLQSLDGERVDFTSIVMNVLGGTAFQWSADGNRLVVDSFVNDVYTPYVITIETGDAFPLTHQTSFLLP